MICRLRLHLNDKHTWPCRIISISDITGLNFPSWPCLFVRAYIITSDFWSPRPLSAVSYILTISAWSETQSHWQLSLLERNRQQSPAPLKLPQNNISLCASACWADISIRGSMEAGLHWVGLMEDREIKRQGGKMTSGGECAEGAEGADVGQKTSEETSRKRGDTRRRQWNYYCKQADNRQSLISSNLICPVVDISVCTARWVAEEDSKVARHVGTAGL